MNTSSDPNAAGESTSPPSVSADGRFVAFDSAGRLVNDDTNGTTADIYVRDSLNGTTERVSVASDGTQADGPSYAPSISRDGRWVVFESQADNLVPNDSNGKQDIFLHDRQTGTTTLVSVATGGMQGDADSENPVVSDDGRFVAFDTYADTLDGASSPFPHYAKIMLRDVVSSTTTVETSLLDGEGQSYFTPSISGDGSRLVWYANNGGEIVVDDLATSTTTRVDEPTGNPDGTGISGASTDHPRITDDGRYVVFTSQRPLVLPDDLVNGMGTDDVFVHDMQTGSTERVRSPLSDVPTDANALAFYGEYASISDDGRFVSFRSSVNDVFQGLLVDRQDGASEIVSTTGLLQPGTDVSSDPIISGDGRYVAFRSLAPNLTNSSIFTQVFERAVPVPAVTSVTPSTVPANATTVVTINGSGFLVTPEVTVVGNTNPVAVKSVVRVSDTELTVTLTTSGPIGPDNIEVTLAGTGPGAGRGTTGLCSQCLTVS